MYNTENIQRTSALRCIRTLDHKDVWFLRTLRYWGKSLLFFFFTFFFRFRFFNKFINLPLSAWIRCEERTKNLPLVLTRPLDRCYEISKEPQDKITFRLTATDWAKESNNKIISVLCLNGPMLCKSDASRLRVSYRTIPVKSFRHPCFSLLSHFTSLSVCFPISEKAISIVIENRHPRPVICLSPLIKKKNRKIYKSEIMHHFGLPEALSVSLLLRFANRLVVSRRWKRDFWIRTCLRGKARRHEVLPRAFDFIWCTVVN